MLSRLVIAFLRLSVNSTVNESILHIFSNIKTNNVLLDKEREGGDFTMNHNDDNEQPR